MLSIIFLHWVRDNKGPLQETRLSLASVLTNTTTPYELIIVSNGTYQEFNDELHTIINSINKEKFPFLKEVKFIDLPENLGVSKGFNAGLKKISNESKYISIYANDWLASPNWSELMIEELDKDPYCGFATACTNWGSGSMCDARENPVSFKKPDLDKDDKNIWNKLEIIAKHTLQARGHTSYNAFPCVGFMIKREVFDKIGLFDERIFCANDVAWGKLGANLGYTSKTIWAAYIHHWFHSSFSQINDPIKYDYLRPKDEADRLLIFTDPKYQVK